MKKQIILLIIGAIVVLIIGGGVGVFYKTQQISPLLTLSENAVASIKILSSKEFPSIIAVGNVEKISGRNITLSYQGQTIELTVPQNAKISSFNIPAIIPKIPVATSKPSTLPNPNQQKLSNSIETETTFGSIKVGDNLSANVKILSDGQIGVESILVIPASNNSANNTTQK